MFPPPVFVFDAAPSALYPVVPVLFLSVSVCPVDIGEQPYQDGNLIRACVVGDSESFVGI